MKFEGPAGNVLVLLEYLLIRENLKKKIRNLKMQEIQNP